MTASGITGSAFAADLPTRAPPPPVPIFTWTSVYLGGQIGYAWGSDNVTWFGTANDADLADGTFSASSHGVIGGAHVDYNLQINPWLVIGIEGRTARASVEFKRYRKRK